MQIYLENCALKVARLRTWHHQLRLLAESADQLLERFGLGLCLIRLMAGAQDCYSGGFEFGSDIPLQEIGESSEGEAILYRRWALALM